MDKKQKISTESYKGVRDFYPEDMAIENYIFSIWRKTAESFGYSEYNASILEPTELYKAKSGEEIVNEQTYSFKDRGDRDVTLRPEMTPTVARMIAGKRRELKFPLRWYSIPNLFRYERPQRGRLREHFQLNCDLFGLEGIEAEVEIISLAHQIMKNFGVEKKTAIRIGYTGLGLEILKHELGFDDEKSFKFLKFKDRYENKISPTEFDNKIIEEFGVDTLKSFNELMSRLNNEQILSRYEKFNTLLGLVKKIENKFFGIKIVANPFLTRGFDYYTGVIFEIYDNSDINPRALFGGGRYDNLLDIFGVEKIPTIGFGMGDVTIRDVLETYDLLPKLGSKTVVSILPFDKNCFDEAEKLAETLRKEKINVSVDYSEKKIGDRISRADKEKIRFVIPIGEQEISSRTYKLKELITKEEVCADIKTLIQKIKE